MDILFTSSPLLHLFFYLIGWNKVLHSRTRAHKACLQTHLLFSTLRRIPYEVQLGIAQACYFLWTVYNYISNSCLPQSFSGISCYVIRIFTACAVTVALVIWKQYSLSAVTWTAVFFLRNPLSRLAHAPLCVGGAGVSSKWSLARELSSCDHPNHLSDGHGCGVLVWSVATVVPRHMHTCVSKFRTVQPAGRTSTPECKAPPVQHMRTL